MIIIEGTDLVGKTTLANELWKRDFFQQRGTEIQHLSRLPTGHDRCMDYINRLNPTSIFDRFDMSELAYLKARGDRLPWPYTPDKQKYVQAAKRDNDAFTVLVVVAPQDWESVMSKRATREEMYGGRIIKKANDAFLELYDRHSTTGCCVGHADILITLTRFQPFITAIDIDCVEEAYRERINI